jgi:hypothetical protein
MDIFYMRQVLNFQKEAAVMIWLESMKPSLLICTKYKKERWLKITEVKSISTSKFVPATLFWFIIFKIFEWSVNAQNTFSSCDFLSLIMWQQVVSISKSISYGPVFLLISTLLFNLFPPGDKVSLRKLLNNLGCITAFSPLADQP